MTTRLRSALAVLGLVGFACTGSRAPPERKQDGPERAPGPGTGATQLLDSLVAKGESAYAEGEYAAAAAGFRVALAAAKSAGDATVEAKLLTSLGLASYWLGDYQAARAFGEEALGLKTRLSLRAELFRSYNALGLLAWSEGRHVDALGRYGEALEEARAKGDESGVAKVANNVALVQAELGNFAEARQGFLESGRAARSLHENLIEGRALTNLGMLDIQVGHPRAAIGSLIAARRLLRSVGDLTGEQNALGQLGTAYEVLGEPRLAFAALDSALRLSREQGLLQEEASNLELIAGLHRQAGDLQRALQLFEQAQAINGQLGNAVEQGTNRRSAAEIQLALGRKDLARANTLEALRLHRASVAPLQELRDLLQLADVASAADSPAVAERHVQAANRLGRTLDTRVARVEVSLADATLTEARGDARGVLRILRSGEADLKQSGFGAEWQAARLRARAYTRLDQLDSAVAAGRQAIGAAERLRGNYGSVFLRQAFTADKSSAYGDLVEVLLRQGRTAEAFDISDQARSNALVEHLAAATSGETRTSATVQSAAEGEDLLRRVDSLVARLDALEETPARGRDAATRAQALALGGELTEARGAYETLLIRVGERDAPGSVLLGWRSAEAREVQQALNPGEALVEYLVTRDRVVIFVVTRDKVQSVSSEIAREDLARRVRLARDLLGAPGSGAGAHDEVLRGLHAVLVAPVEQAGLVRGVERLILIPHSVLTYLPFAALKRAEGGRYLMEDYALLHLPSAATLAVLRGADRGGAGDRSGGRATVFAPFPKELPGSLREAGAFRRAVTRASTQSGRAATEARLRRALAGNGVVHVASHGVMNPRNPMFSRIELFPGDGGASDDGRLEVHELLALRIGASLVFLSGCETGVGSAWSTQFARGEDYTTLAQAFLYAGAGNVVATLWRIGDDGAAAFAAKFYANDGTVAPARALASAQRAMARDPRYLDPYYWAAYQVFGPGGMGPSSHRSAGSSVQPR